MFKEGLEHFDKNNYEYSFIAVFGRIFQYTVAFIVGIVGLWIFPYFHMFINYNCAAPDFLSNLVIAMILQVCITADVVVFIIDLLIIHPIVSYCLRGKNIIAEKFDYKMYLSTAMLICLILITLDR